MRVGSTSGDRSRRALLTGLGIDNVGSRYGARRGAHTETNRPGRSGLQVASTR